jgi:hypothetical protein
MQISGGNKMKIIPPAYKNKTLIKLTVQNIFYCDTYHQFSHLTVNKIIII